MHDCVMHIGVKRLTESFDLSYAELFESLVKLHHRHLHALAVRFVGCRRCQRSFKIVVHRQELEQRVRLYVGVQTLALLLAALAEIIVLGTEPEVLFLFRLDELFGRFLYLGLFFALLLLLFFFFRFFGLFLCFFLYFLGGGLDRFLLYFLGGGLDRFFLYLLGLRLLPVFIFFTAHLLCHLP